MGGGLAVRPGRQDFLELAATHDVVPVLLEVMSDTVTPFGLLTALARSGRNPFLLESVEGGERVARYSYVGADPWRVLEVRGGRCYVDGVPSEGKAVDVLRSETRAGRVAPLPGAPPFLGGALGVLGYDAVRLVERVPDSGRDETGLPDAWFGLYDTVVALDRARQTLVLVTSARLGDGDPSVAWQAAVGRLEGLRARLAAAGGAPRLDAIPQAIGDPWAGWQATPSEPAYLAAVAAAREHILAGDIFQVVLSRRWRRMPRASAAAIYRMLRLTNPSPYMFFLDTGQARVFGSSPEMLVSLRGGVVATCPIAGTRRRGADPEEDRRLEAELLADPKERAEHVMLVDLGRNDVGRVAAPGTVRVTREMEVERYSHVMHLVSEVSGRLADGADAWDALFACFPAGTLSGAPKVRAMEIVDGLEEVRRGVYGGAVGFVDLAGDADFCIAIRTLVERGGVVHVQAGAGIVYDSVPSSELTECRNKATALVQAVAMAETADEEGSA